MHVFVVLIAALSLILNNERFVWLLMIYVIEKLSVNYILLMFKEYKFLLFAIISLNFRVSFFSLKTGFRWLLMRKSELSCLPLIINRLLHCVLILIMRWVNFFKELLLFCFNY